MGEMSMRNIKTGTILTALLLILAACTKDAPLTGGAGIFVAPKSISRFIASNNNLYVAAQQGLKVFNTANAVNPTDTKTIGFAYQDLTNFTAYQDMLVVGSAAGIAVYNVPTAPANVPANGLTYNTCTPLVTNGKCVFISERINTDCGGTANQLQVIDVRTATRVVTKYQLTAPYGLAVDGDNLFICDGGAIKFYDASNPAALVLKQTIAASAVEVTAQNGKLAAVSANTVYQYTYTGGTLVEQSNIKIK
jgi:hypothetical protein